MGEDFSGGGGDGQQQGRALHRCESKLPLTADPGKLMVAAVPSQLFVDSSDGTGGGLLIRMQRLSQCSQPLPEIQHLLERGGVSLVQFQTLSTGPARNSGGVGEEVGWRVAPTTGGVDEIQPDGVAQQSEFRLKHRTRSPRPRQCSCRRAWRDTARYR